ncbi:Caleosin-domain-containing protein [Hypoxylon sp. EC38]|nr:Caleosin-domain-containing protein [Hypoxylon sp. EC38]
MSSETKKIPSTNDMNGSPPLVTSISNVKITSQRKPFIQPDDDQRLPHTGTARANVAATYEKPYGTTENGWDVRHKDKTVLQQHCDFFDFDHDGVIWPQDTFRGFHQVGFGITLSLVAVFIIHANFSYPTLSSWLPDPFFRIYTVNVHKDKHGSDTGTYDTEGRFSPQHFEDIFAKYAERRDYLTIWDVWGLLKGLATYLMLWPADGKMKKEDIRGIYDGSIFYTMANQRAATK